MVEPRIKAEFNYNLHAEEIHCVRINSTFHSNRFFGRRRKIKIERVSCCVRWCRKSSSSAVPVPLVFPEKTRRMVRTASVRGP